MLRIFSSLSMRSILCLLPRVCSSWHRLARNEHLWRYLVQRDLPSQHVQLFEKHPEGPFMRHNAFNFYKWYFVAQRDGFAQNEQVTPKLPPKKRWFSSERDYPIMLWGLSGAGKTSMVRLHAKDEDALMYPCTPTPSFALETITHKDLDFVLQDVGGKAHITGETLQRQCAFLFAVDLERPDLLSAPADDQAVRLDSAAYPDHWDSALDGSAEGRLRWLLRHPALPTRAPLVVVCSKRDMVFDIDPVATAARLGLFAVKDRAWCIVAGHALDPEGNALPKALSWLAGLFAPPESVF